LKLSAFPILGGPGRDTLLRPGVHLVAHSALVIGQQICYAIEIGQRDRSFDVV
jgi:hypothetical protein